MTGVAVLGSTGSIGRQALEVIDRLRDRFEVVALATGHESETFEAQRAAWPRARTWTHGGTPSAEPLVELATLGGVEIVVVATTGMTALPAVLAALTSGRRVALANKETLVTGGHLVEAALARLETARLDRLRPVDSEHSAIWQCLLGEPREAVRRLVLTASGGPFRDREPASLSNVTPDQALAHPTWRMGPKITIDSATLVNKAFEVIEARWLYGLPYSKIDAVIHPSSVVHSLVEFADGSYKAQLGLPDMRLPIQYALTHPERLPAPAVRADPTEWGELRFGTLDPDRFPAYGVVRAAAAVGGNRGTIVNAADEIAVAAFLMGQLPFTGIASLIDGAVQRWGSDLQPALETVIELDAEIRATLAAELGLRGVA